VLTISDAPDREDAQVQAIRARVRMVDAEAGEQKEQHHARVAEVSRKRER
jgi:hypothetical protein